MGGAIMPSHVRTFFWIIVALITYWIFSAALALAYHRGRPFNDQVIFIRIFATAIQCLIYLIPAWLAAFHRQNWARWVFAAIVVVAPILALWPLLYLTGHFRDIVLQAYFTTLTNPKSIAVNALSIAAIVFVFTGNAREWFKRSVPREVRAIQP
jgi:hypothetical protein